MDKQRFKAIDKSAKAVLKKAEEREKAGCDKIKSGWQAVLEMMLVMMEKHLNANPGQLLQKMAYWKMTMPNVKRCLIVLLLKLT